MDAPFPVGMVTEIEQFLTNDRESPGQDIYPAVFGTERFFPLQRQNELVAMMRTARQFGPPCPACNGDGSASEQMAVEGGYSHTDERKTVGGFCSVCRGQKVGPRVVMEIGADKGGGLYHWCKCLPSVKHVIACEIRGLPYKRLFERAFPDIRFSWFEGSSYDRRTVSCVANSLAGNPIDCLFIDGDKLGFVRDFDAYLPLMRRPSVVFMHDIQDREPRSSFEEVRARGYETETILDTLESEVAIIRQERGEPILTPYEGWLRHWRGRSCGVGVVKLMEDMP